MKKKRLPKSPTEDLRARAERFLTEAGPDQEKVFIEFTEDVGRLVHELQVHQIELGMQNGELRRANQELEELRFKYTDLYEFAPVGYVTLDPKGQILEVNLTGAKLLGLDRHHVLSTPFFLLIEPESRAVFHSHLKQAFATGGRQTCELQLSTGDGPPFFVSMESIVAQDLPVQPKQCRSAISDITDRKQAQEALSLKQTVASLRKALEQTVQALSSTTAMRDAYTTRHQAKVAQLAAAIARELGFSSDRVEGMRIMGLLHDIGNMAIPLELLSKSGGTSEWELAIIREHVLAGYETVKAIDFPWPVAQAILQHHERLDGSGYPSGLSGQDIIVEARVLMVADMVDTIACDLPHRPGLGIDQALKEIKQNRSILYDPEIVDVCVRLFQEKGFRFDQQE